ncbi:hypothetical protein DYBT9623_01550 [Dyadobacter sp. CECT 9623]|uniref:Uncharacterized protein n=1 Tax=Dyadobacter linearis TaxID=2823330 RepID=A0ABM8UN29_9BACT|nr:hypothetical protein DYBT9623_01550 [Dyadobacter sp. CECT 9623]
MLGNSLLYKLSPNVPHNKYGRGNHIYVGNFNIFAEVLFPFSYNSFEVRRFSMQPDQCITMCRQEQLGAKTNH